MKRTHRRTPSSVRNSKLAAAEKPYTEKNRKFFISHAGLLSALTEKGCLVNVSGKPEEVLLGLGEEEKQITELNVVLPAVVTLNKDIHELAEKSGLKQVRTSVRSYGVQITFA